MESSLLIGDYVFIDKLLYAPAKGGSKHLHPYRYVQRGDIIVFRHPLNTKVEHVKRAIGLAGDSIRFQNKRLILNGKRVEECRQFPLRAAQFWSAAASLGHAAEVRSAWGIGGSQVMFSRWATTVRIPMTAAIGDWCLAPTSKGRRSIYWSFAPEKYSRDFDPTIGSGRALKGAIDFVTRMWWSRTLRVVGAECAADEAGGNLSG